MDYSTMEAGREMDALIAEKVMGESFRRYSGFNTSGSYQRETPPHSTDIAAAWEVVEMIKHPFEIFISGLKNDPFVSVKIIIGDDYFEASADTAPLAICRAALMAQKEG